VLVEDLQSKCLVKFPTMLVVPEEVEVADFLVTNLVPELSV
jgi:hypothetical protein